MEFGLGASPALSIFYMLVGVAHRPALFAILASCQDSSQNLAMLFQSKKSVVDVANRNPPQLSPHPLMPTHCNSQHETCAQVAERLGIRLSAMPLEEGRYWVVWPTACPQALVVPQASPSPSTSSTPAVSSEGPAEEQQQQQVNGVAQQEVPLQQDETNQEPALAGAGRSSDGGDSSEEATQQVPAVPLSQSVASPHSLAGISDAGAEEAAAAAAQHDAQPRDFYVIDPYGKGSLLAWQEVRHGYGLFPCRQGRDCKPSMISSPSCNPMPMSDCSPSKPAITPRTFTPGTYPPTPLSPAFLLHFLLVRRYVRSLG